MDRVSRPCDHMFTNTDTTNQKNFTQEEEELCSLQTHTHTHRYTICVSEEVRGQLWFPAVSLLSQCVSGGGAALV